MNDKPFLNGDLETKVREHDLILFGTRDRSKPGIVERVEDAEKILHGYVRPKSAGIVERMEAIEKLLTPFVLMLEQHQKMWAFFNKMNIGADLLRLALAAFGLGSVSAGVAAFVYILKLVGVLQ